MISSEVRKTIDIITHSLDLNTLESLAARWRSMKKEPGGFGSAESAALHYCLLHRCEPSAIRRKALYVISAEQSFAAAECAGATTAQARFSALLSGATPGAALARLTATETVIINAAVSGVPENGAVTLRLDEASGDATKGPAMTQPLANEALEAGIVLATDASRRFDVIGLACLDGRTNPSASALAAALLGSASDKWLYNEPSLEPLQASRRRDAVRAALTKHQANLALPFEALRLVGSIDLAVMTGVLLGAALRRLPVVIDGFAATVAAFTAARFAPDTMDVCLFSHANASPAHADLLALMAVTPMLGSGISEEGGYGAALALHHLDLTLRILQVFNLPATLE